MQVEKILYFHLKIEIEKSDFYRLLCALRVHKDDDEFDLEEKSYINNLYARYNSGSIKSNENNCFIYVHNCLELYLIHKIVSYEEYDLFINNKRFVTDINDLYYRSLNKNDWWVTYER